MKSIRSTRSSVPSLRTPAGARRDTGNARPVTGINTTSGRGAAVRHLPDRDGEAKARKLCLPNGSDVLLPQAGRSGSRCSLPSWWLCWGPRIEPPGRRSRDQQTPRLSAGANVIRRRCSRAARLDASQKPAVGTVHPPDVGREDHGAQHMTRSRFFGRLKQNRANAATSCAVFPQCLQRTRAYLSKEMKKSPARSGA